MNDLNRVVRNLALSIRDEVRPHCGGQDGRRHHAEGLSGDITFAIDEVAESHLEHFVKSEATNMAFYSEDRGLVTGGGECEYVLIVDPIDGTRPAMAGLESCCVSVAVAPFRDGVTMGEVSVGCIAEIKSDVTFVAGRGEGVQIEGGTVALNGVADLSRIFWTLGFRGRPARVIADVLGDLIDQSSVGGGVFDLGSATFDITRILTGQMDAYLDVGTRIIDEVPQVKDDFERVGGGAILNNSPYDLAAAVLCLQEAGGIVTDAYGKELDSRALLGSGHDFQMSCVAAANRELHRQLLGSIDQGIEKLRDRLQGQL